MKFVTFRMTLEDYAKLKAEANKQERSVSKQIMFILNDFFKKASNEQSVNN